MNLHYFLPICLLPNPPSCLQVPQQLCGPSGCGFVQGPEICHDEVKQGVVRGQ